MTIPVTSGTVILIEDCNLACTYCYEENGGRQNGKKMSKATAEKTIEFFIKNAKEGGEGKIVITFFGGEPTLNVDTMRHMFDYGNVRTKQEGLGFECQIVSNGTVWTEEYEKFLKHWYTCHGQINVQLSIDGSPEVQDKNRLTKTGAGSSALVSKVVESYSRFMRQNGIPMDQVHVHGCVTRDSLPFMKESYDYYRDTLGLLKIWFMAVHEEDWGPGCVEEFDKQLNLIGDRIVEDCKADGNASHFDNFSSFNCVAVKPNAPCGAGKNFCAVDTEGKVYPCHRFMFHDRSMIIGNIAEGVDDDEREFFLEYSMENIYGDMNCSDCSNKSCEICIAANLESNQNMAIGFPKYCVMSRKEDEIRWEIREKLVKAGLLKRMKKPVSACSTDGCGDGSACGTEGGCGENCTCGTGGGSMADYDMEEILDEVRNTYRPVFEQLDAQFRSFDDLNKEYVKIFNAIDGKASEADQKASQALEIALSSIELSQGLVGIIEKLHMDLEILKQSQTK